MSDFKIEPLNPYICVVAVRQEFVRQRQYRCKDLTALLGNPTYEASNELNSLTNNNNKTANVHIYQIYNLGLQLCSHLPGSACSLDPCHTSHQGVTPDKRLARRHVEYHQISHRRCRMHLLHILLVTTRKKIMPQGTWE